MKILVIDDESFIRDIIKKFSTIKKIDFTGIEDVLKLKNMDLDYDIYFVDYSIDKIDDISVSNYIKSKNKEARIILMSGYNEEEIDDEERQYYDDFLFKPELGERILDIFSKYIDN